MSKLYAKGGTLVPVIAHERRGVRGTLVPVIGSRNLDP